MKVIAVSTPPESHYSYRVIVELTDREIDAFERKGRGSTTPKVGEEINIQPVLDRLYELEQRERDLKHLGELLTKFLPKPNPSEPTQDNG